MEHALAALPRGVELPPEEIVDEAPQGPLPSRPNDGRRFPRFYYLTEAILRIRPTLPALARPRQDFVILARNISREGIGFLHEGQLFPGEQVLLWLPGERRAQFVVERCRKVNDRCYEVGGGSCWTKNPRDPLNPVLFPKPRITTQRAIKFAPAPLWGARAD